jgi:hypothetical protein
MFEDDIFRAHARQFAHLGHEYEALGLNDMVAAQWANAGFLPAEAKYWIDANFDVATATRYADHFVTVAEAVARRAAA